VTIHRFRTSLLSAALVLGLAAQAEAQPASQEQLTLSMPTMPLGDALRQLARVSGRNLVVDDQLVAGKTALALSGRFSPEEAIQRLLEASGLSSRTVDGTIVISGPLAGVAERGGGAQNHEDAEIVVTGTHVRGAPPTSPVITLTRRQIEEAAPASVEELMRKLPQNVSAGAAQENFGVTGTGSDITDQGAGINLRGLGQRATLVLVDGRRIAPSGTGSFVDVSLIPVSAIERVEILTDGASAIYGSDAVGGVVNFILRDDVRGIEPMVQVGTSTQGGGNQLLASLTAGADWRGGRGLLSYEYRDEGRIRAGQRDFTINLPADWSLYPREKRHSLYGTARQQLAPNLRLDLTGMFADRTTDRSFFIAGPAVPVNQHARSRSFGGTVALALDLASWRTEGSAAYYRSHSREREVQPLGQGFFNSYATRNSILEFGLKADGPLVELPAGAAKLALGGGLRRESFSGVFESPVNLPNPQSGSRKVEALYGELVVPLFSTRNRRAGLEALTATAAGRLEHYEGLGSTFNPKLGLLWSPVRGLSLRSSYATSFRAPLLSESLGYYNIFLFPAALLYIDPSEAPPGVGAALVGNDPDVRPEQSRSFSAGAEFAPPGLPGLRLTATYYAIRFTNRIALPTDQVVVVGDPALEPIVARNPELASVTGFFKGAGQVLDFSGPGFTNGGATPADVVVIVDARTSNTAESRTSGLDLGADYAWALGPNRFRLGVNVNHVFRFDDRLTATSPVIHTLNTPFHALRWRGRGGASWSRGPFSAVLFVNYAGPYHDRRAGVSRPVHSYTTVDAGIAFSGSAKNGPLLNKLRLALNVQNLLDRSPPRLLPEPGFTKDIGYDPVNASGRGRTISFQIRRSW
jgi:outer membrane receptor protein involved in Fe transport